MPEPWKDVRGYEDLYQVSSLGRVRSLPHSVRTIGGDGLETVRKSPGRVLSVRGKDRPWVQLWKSNERSQRSMGKNHRVCRLVLEAFVGPCPFGMESCHFPDRDTTNNRLENLRWDTRRANAMDRDRHGTMFRGEKHPSHVLTKEIVLEARRLRKQGWTFKSLQERCGCGFSTIYKAVVGITWSHV